MTGWIADRTRLQANYLDLALKKLKEEKLASDWSRASVSSQPRAKFLEAIAREFCHPRGKPSQFKF